MATSCTRDLVNHKVKYGNTAFNLIDTPGTDSTEEYEKHMILLEHAITSIPLNTIFVILKFDVRYIKLI